MDWRDSKNVPEEIVSLPKTPLLRKLQDHERHDTQERLLFYQDFFGAELFLRKATKKWAGGKIRKINNFNDEHEIDKLSAKTVAYFEYQKAGAKEKLTDSYVVEIANASFNGSGKKQLSVTLSYEQWGICLKSDLNGNPREITNLRRQEIIYRSTLSKANCKSRLRNSFENHLKRD